MADAYCASCDCACIGWLFISFRLILNYAEGVAMLRANGIEMGDEEDLRLIQSTI